MEVWSTSIAHRSCIKWLQSVRSGVSSNVDGLVVSNFSSWCYSGQLPTAAFGFNAHIAMSMNYLHTEIGGSGWRRVSRRLQRNCPQLRGAIHILCLLFFVFFTRTCSTQRRWKMHGIESQTHLIVWVIITRSWIWRTVVLWTLKSRPSIVFQNSHCLMCRWEDSPRFQIILISTRTCTVWSLWTTRLERARFIAKRGTNRWRSRAVSMTLWRFWATGEDWRLLICREDKVEPIYRNTTLNTALYDFFRRECVVYAGPASEKRVIASYPL